MKNEQEKSGMISKLNLLKETVPAKSFFGDDNHRGIDYQIKVIKEGLDEDEIYDRELEDNTTDMALLAVQWLNGQVDDDSLTEW